MVALSLPLFSDSIDIGFKSYHFNKTNDYEKMYPMNENNPGIIYNFDNGLSIGYIHKNTVKEKSYIVKYSVYEWLAIGLNYGKYSKKHYCKGECGNYDYIILDERDVLPIVSIEKKFFDYLKVSLIPPVPKELGGGMGIIYFGLSLNL